MNSLNLGGLELQSQQPRPTPLLFLPWVLLPALSKSLGFIPPQQVSSLGRLSHTQQELGLPPGTSQDPARLVQWWSQIPMSLSPPPHERSTANRWSLRSSQASASLVDSCSLVRQHDITGHSVTSGNAAVLEDSGGAWQNGVGLGERRRD